MTGRTASLLAWAVFAGGYSLAYLFGGFTAGDACSGRSGTGCDIATYWEPLDDNRASGWLPFWGPLFGVILVNGVLLLTRRYRMVLLVSGVAVAWLVVQAVLVRA